MKAINNILIVVALLLLQACAGYPKKAQVLPGGLKVSRVKDWELKSGDYAPNVSQQITLVPVKGKDPNLRALVMLTFEYGKRDGFVNGTKRIREEWVTVQDTRVPLVVYGNNIARYYCLDFYRNGSAYFATLVISGSCDEEFYKMEMLRIVGSLM